MVKADLFVTCIVDRMYPQVGVSSVRVLRRLGVDVSFKSAQVCCGQPAFNSGYWSDAKPLGERFLSIFSDSENIVVPSGSCASMIKIFYSQLFADDSDNLAKVKNISGRIYELSEFIVNKLGVIKLRCNESQSKLKITYHESCHLKRELKADNQAISLIKNLPNTELMELDQREVCCGFGGTFSVKYSDISGAMLKDKVDRIIDTQAQVVTSCDISCLMHIEGGLQKRNSTINAMHLAELLDLRTTL